MSKSPTPRVGSGGSVSEIDALSYSAFVGGLKQKIAAARHKAGLSVNRELVVLYWSIGRDILGGRNARAGVPRSSSAWPRTSAGPFLR